MKYDLFCVYISYRLYRSAVESCVCCAPVVASAALLSAVSFSQNPRLVTGLRRVCRHYDQDCLVANVLARVLLRTKPRTRPWTATRTADARPQARPHVSPDPCRPARRDRVLLAARSAAVRRAAAGVRCGRLRFRPFSPALRSVRECGYLPYSAGAPAGAARAQLHLSQLAATSYFELVSCVCIKTSVIFPHSRFARPGYYVHARPGGAPPGPAAQP